jgi:hypothetical protein
MTVPRSIVPVLVVLLALAGLVSARLFAIPSLELEFPAAAEEPGAATREVSLLVDGVKCVDTARQAASALEELPGVRRFVAYASRNRVDVTYDPSLVDVGQLSEALEGPVFDEDSGEFLFGVYEIIEVDGKPVSE